MITKENTKEKGGLLLKDFLILTEVFDDIIFNVDKPLINMKEVISLNRHLDFYIKGGNYYITYRKTNIAYCGTEPNSPYVYKLFLTPGFYIHRNIDVFKTYNKLLKVLTDSKQFIKYINFKWVVCKEKI